MKVLFCLQRPLLVGFVDLIAGEEFVPHPDADAMVDEPTWNHNFTSVPKFSYSDEDEYMAVSEVHVLGDTVWRGRQVVVSDGDWRSLDIAMQLLPEKKVSDAQDPGEQRAPRTSEVASLVAEFPWLADMQAKAHRPHLGEVRHPGLRGPKSGASDEAGSEPHSPSASAGSGSADDMVSLVDEKEVLNALVAKRNEMAQSGAAAEEAFSWKVMGGVWTKAHLGLDYDAFRAEGRTQHAREFVSLYALPKSASFTLALCGEDTAKLLAGYRCLRMTHFYNIWSRSKLAKHVFSDADSLSFPEPAAFGALMLTAPGKILSRMQGLRSLSPGAPGR